MFQLVIWVCRALIVCAAIVGLPVLGYFANGYDDRSNMYFLALWVAGAIAMALAWYLLDKRKPGA